MDGCIDWSYNNLWQFASSFWKSYAVQRKVTYIKYGQIRHQNLPSVPENVSCTLLYCINIYCCTVVLTWWPYSVDNYWWPCRTYHCCCCIIQSVRQQGHSQDRFTIFSSNIHVNIDFWILTLMTRVSGMITSHLGLVSGMLRGQWMMRIGKTMSIANR